MKILATIPYLKHQLLMKVLKYVPSDYTPPSNCNQEQLDLLTQTFGVTVSTAKTICSSTVQQSQNSEWYTERFKRVNSSVFGKVVNRRKSTYRKSLVKSITE